jgi:hypothetical protein
VWVLTSDTSDVFSSANQQDDISSPIAPDISDEFRNVGGTLCLPKLQMPAKASLFNNLGVLQFGESFAKTIPRAVEQ